MSTFDDGWICKSCWKANRDADLRCYRCKQPNPELQRIEAADEPREPLTMVVRRTVRRGSTAISGGVRFLSRGVTSLALTFARGVAALGHTIVGVLLIFIGLARTAARGSGSAVSAVIAVSGKAVLTTGRAARRAASWLQLRTRIAALRLAGGLRAVAHRIGA